MSEFLSQLEEYIFDIVGLILPGFICLLLVSAPLLLFDFNTVPQEELSQYTNTFNFTYYFKYIETFY